ncbi:glycine cleavage system protein H [Lactobacillus sp. 0.1XD8-4]|uniref:Glycine cleavage system protein H n=1 Tax=Limosilactobacillus walteri TaxID=2268022 RepID=A0ABR8P8L3_9LACO|nr:glycine cleavage system protein H [Limosilactobacillus walteri]MBD5807051.1 glycine cleavage system protein H [Limosilactobacillus walteri]MRN06571.1 glycine cleavage system protein H [Lactobacillus sp. 0.1XD8-4]
MAKSYFWVKEQADGTKRVGLNDTGRDELGAVSFVDVPAAGTTLKHNDKFIAVEAEKAVTDVDSPIDGKIVKINEGIIDDPAGLNSTDEAKNWIVEVKD